MLKETGRVVAVESNFVWVETIPSSLCGKCAARKGCGQGVLASITGHRGLVRALESPSLQASDCSVNDEVEIELPESSVLKGSMLVYLAPLLFAIAAVLLAQSFGELAIVGAFVAGLGCGFAAVRLAPRWLGGVEAFEPRLASVVTGTVGVIARQ